MKVYEKIKEMSVEELQAFLRMLGADANDIYCNSICMQVCNYADCYSVNALAEVLNADYSLVEKEVRGEYEKMFCS